MAALFQIDIIKEHPFQPYPKDMLGVYILRY